ncbi:hypothetical protein TYRP_006240 [Tyrophagus putrescentiae]|nr:hypothetical protein TYRP_006240 [Tyrophagus putrescentiae]
MFFQLSSLLSTSAYIGIGSAYKLYQHFYDSQNSELLSNSSNNNNSSETKLADLNFNCLLRLLEQVPLEQRILSLRQLFLRLKTLAIVVSDPTEDVDYLEHLPRLVTAYVPSLTTLQIVFNLPNAPFHAVLTPLVEAIDGLPHLERLSLFDYANCLTVPPFNLPRLFASTTFRTFDFF